MAFVFLIPPSPFSSSPLPHTPLATINLFSVYINMFLFGFVCSIVLIIFNFTYKWNQTVFVLLSMTYFTCIMSSWFIHVVTKSKILFFFNWTIILCVCVCMWITPSLSSVTWHLSCFHVLDVVNNTSMDILEFVFILFPLIRWNCYLSWTWRSGFV